MTLLFLLTMKESLIYSKSYLLCYDVKEDTQIWTNLNMKISNIHIDGKFIYMFICKMVHTWKGLNHIHIHKKLMSLKGEINKCKFCTQIHWI